jgi:iron complex outermembrane receptor protein
MKKNLRARVAAPALSLVALACVGAWGEPSVDSMSEIQPILVTGTRIEMKDVDAPYASEVHTRDEIKSSGASSLYDFLAHFTSLQISPGYGDKASPNIDARGYGLATGTENIAVLVDGRRLNNIDSANPFLGSISLQDIERIEITLGSGAVLYGDGAMAGSVNIITKYTDGARVDAYAGSNGVWGMQTKVGLTKDNFYAYVSADTSNSNGTSQANSVGQTDSSVLNNAHFNSGWKFENQSSLNLSVAHSDINHWFPGSLTASEWSANPAQTPSNFNQQKIANDFVGFDFSLPVASGLMAKMKISDETKRTEWVTYSSVYNYETQNAEFSLEYKKPGYTAVGGVQVREGNRTSSSGTDPNTMYKNNQSLFFQAHHIFDQITWMYGFRHDWVNYSYNPIGSASLDQANGLNSWETGVNYRLDERNSLFANFSRSMRAPDIDSFFNPVYDMNFNLIGQSFNGYISPMEARTYTVGLNRLDDANKLRLDVYYSDVRNEIYFDPLTFYNTNLSKTHKYGLELRDNIIFNKSLSGSFNYTYTVALIDADNALAGGAYSGSQLPGVSKNVVTAGLNWKPDAKSTLIASQTWRSSAYALNDFQNQMGLAQTIYRSTDLNYMYSFTDKTQAYLSVVNLFNQSNGIWITNNTVYPYDFSRQWKIGIRMDL